MTLSEQFKLLDYIKFFKYRLGLDGNEIFIFVRLIDEQKKEFSKSGIKIEKYFF